MNGPPSLSKTINRRKAARAACGGRCRLIGRKTVTGQIEDISTTGIKVSMPAPLPKRGTELQVSFCLPEDEREITTRAEVIRHQGVDGVALRFIRLDVEELAALARFVESVGG